MNKLISVVYVNRLSWMFLTPIFLMTDCRKSPVAPMKNQPQVPQDVVWNFEDHHLVNDVDWVTTSNPANDYLFELKRKVTIKLMGRTSTFPVHDVRLGRNGNSLEIVGLSLEKETLENAYADAKDLARVWSLPLAGLDKWHDLAYSNQNAYGLSTVAWREPGISVELTSSYDDERPWIIYFTITWPNPEIIKRWPATAKLNW